MAMCHFYWPFLQIVDAAPYLRTPCCKLSSVSPIPTNFAAPYAVKCCPPNERTVVVDRPVSADKSNPYVYLAALQPCTPT